MEERPVIVLLQGQLGEVLAMLGGVRIQFDLDDTHRGDDVEDRLGRQFGDFVHGSLGLFRSCDGIGRSLGGFFLRLLGGIAAAAGEQRRCAEAAEGGCQEMFHMAFEDLISRQAARANTASSTVPENSCSQTGSRWR